MWILDPGTRQYIYASWNQVHSVPIPTCGFSGIKCERSRTVAHEYPSLTPNDKVIVSGSIAEGSKCSFSVSQSVTTT